MCVHLNHYKNILPKNNGKRNQHSAITNLVGGEVKFTYGGSSETLPFGSEGVGCGVTGCGVSIVELARCQLCS